MADHIVSYLPYLTPKAFLNLAKTRGGFRSYNAIFDAQDELGTPCKTSFANWIYRGYQPDINKLHQLYQIALNRGWLDEIQ